MAYATYANSPIQKMLEFVLRKIIEFRKEKYSNSKTVKEFLDGYESICHYLNDELLPLYSEGGPKGFDNATVFLKLGVFFPKVLNFYFKAQRVNDDLELDQFKRDLAEMRVLMIQTTTTPDQLKQLKTVATFLNPKKIPEIVRQDYSELFGTDSQFHQCILDRLAENKQIVEDYDRLHQKEEMHSSGSDNLPDQLPLEWVDVTGVVHADGSSPAVKQVQADTHSDEALLMEKKRQYEALNLETASLQKRIDDDQFAIRDVQDKLAKLDNEIAMMAALLRNKPTDWISFFDQMLLLLSNETEKKKKHIPFKLFEKSDLLTPNNDKVESRFYLLVTLLWIGGTRNIWNEYRKKQQSTFSRAHGEEEYLLKYKELEDAIHVKKEHIQLKVTLEAEKEKLGQNITFNTEVITEKNTILTALSKEIKLLETTLQNGQDDADRCVKITEIKNELLKNAPQYSAMMNKLITQVLHMKQYGEKLRKGKNPLGFAVLELGSQLQMELDHFILQHHNKHGKPISLNDFNLFQEKFRSILLAPYQDMGNHHAKWKQHIQNILLMLTAFVSYFIRTWYTKQTIGHSEFFFSKTERQHRIDLVEHSLNGLGDVARLQPCG